MNEKSPPLKHLLLTAVLTGITIVLFSRLLNHWGEFKVWLSKLFG